MTLHELLFDHNSFETKIRVAAEYAELNSLERDHRNARNKLNTKLRQQAR